MAEVNRNDRPKTVSERQEGDGLKQNATANSSPNPQGTPDSDPRLARVMALRQAIADGVYCVPSRAVAESMVEGLLRKTKTPSMMTPSKT